MFMRALKSSAVGSADDLRADWAYGRQGLKSKTGLAFSALRYHVFTFISVRRDA